MDERVEKAMQQWPDVPDVFGWLQLDRRGRWLLRGETISNPKLIEFINRNFIRTNEGSYAFQNGPQRVHVELEATPFVARINDSTTQAFIEDQFGQRLKDIENVHIDPEGQVIFSRPAGPALLQDRDLGLLFDFLTDAHGQTISEEQLLSWLGDTEAAPLGLDMPELQLPIEHAPIEADWPQFFAYKKSLSAPSTS